MIQVMKKILLGLLVMQLQAGEVIAIRKSEDRGVAELGWLSTKYSFSFSEYYDPNFMGFRKLRVINEDVVGPGKGFDTHAHDNMEILTYILDGAIEHKDTMGTHSQIKAGEFQLMAAGSGIEHSEFNPSKKTPVHLLQIWIYPDKKDVKPSYQQKNLSGHTHGLCLVISPDGKSDSMTIHQDAKIYLGRFQSGDTFSHEFDRNRHAWIQLTRGDLKVNGRQIKTGDGVAISRVSQLAFMVNKDSEFLLFDLP